MVNGAQNIDAYKMDGFTETREFEPMGAQKINAYKLKGAQKIGEYEMKGAEKTREYELKGAQKTDAYEPMGAQNVRVDKSEESCVQTEKVQKHVRTKQFMCRSAENDGVEIIHKSQRNRTCQDADVKPNVRDPMED